MLFFLNTYICMRGDGTQFFLHGFADVQFLYKVLYGCFVDALARAGEGLESLVGMGIGLAAQNGLDGLGADGPAVVQIAVDGLLVEHQFAQALEGALYADEHVSHRHTDVAEHGAVREVALQAAYGQLLAQVQQDGIGYAEVAL